uniref:C2H2-type domain-containing protein n=1 Tax=Pseudonaja textilis TaxID=8673 RepID=A0A670ZKY5_PSETE
MLSLFPAALTTNHILIKTEPEDNSAAHETWMMAGETFVERIIKKEEDFDSCMWPRDSLGEIADYSANEGSPVEEAAARVHWQCQIGRQEPPQSYRSLTPSGRNLSSPLVNGSPLMSPHEMGQLSAGPPGEKLWACPLCHQHFRRSDHLLRHQMSHTGTRPHQCPACEKSFTDKSKLTNHFRTHTGERPFHCTDCGKHFVRRHHLAKHQRTHTRENSPGCLGLCFGFPQADPGPICL